MPGVGWEILTCVHPVMFISVFQMPCLINSWLGTSLHFSPFLSSVLSSNVVPASQGVHKEFWFLKSPWPWPGCRKGDRSSLGQGCSAGPRAYCLLGIWALPWTLCGAEGPLSWLDGVGTRFTGRAWGCQLPFICEPDSPWDPKNDSYPQSLCLGNNKRTTLGEPDSRLHWAGSVPTEPRPSPAGPNSAWVWDRGPEGPILWCQKACLPHHPYPLPAAFYFASVMHEWVWMCVCVCVCVTSGCGSLGRAPFRIL